MKRIIATLTLLVFLMGCSATKPVPNITPKRQPINLPLPAPLKLKEVEGEFKVGSSKIDSTYVLSYRGYNAFLYNNKLVAQRIILLTRQIDLIKKYYNKP